VPTIQKVRTTKKKSITKNLLKDLGLEMYRQIIRDRGISKKGI